MTLVQPQAFAGLFKPHRDQVCKRTLARHPLAKARIIFTPAARLADQAHHVLRSFGEMGGQPVLEQLLQFVRQADQRVIGLGGASLMRGGQRSFQVFVVDHRDHRRGQYADGNTGRRQTPNRLDAPVRRRCARLQLARQVRIE